MSAPSSPERGGGRPEEEGALFSKEGRGGAVGRKSFRVVSFSARGVKRRRYGLGRAARDEVSLEKHYQRLVLDVPGLL